MIRAQELNTKAIGGFGRFQDVRVHASREFKLVLLLTLVHIPLGLLLYNAGSLAILHPAAAFFVGLKWAFKKQVALGQVALAAGYIVGSEVLWRMAQIPVFWEFGKYGSIAVMTVALVRRSGFQIPKLPLIYFIALIPGCILTFIEFDLGGARSILSSNLSGPLLLVVSCLFFSNTKLSLPMLSRLCFAVLIPLISVACVTLFYTVTIEDISFTGESNLSTSGGFGPNQVSSMLGLGAYISLICLVLFKNTTKIKVYFALAALLCTTQSVMTFSRGGMYNAAGAILLVALWEFRNPAEAWKRFAPVLISLIVFIAFIFPILNNFTGGSLQERFEDTGTSARSEIVESDLAIFLENPLFGVGVGGAYDRREEYLDRKAMTHTEFSRLLSEHGMFGMVAFLSLIAMAVYNVKRQRSNLGRAFVIGAAAWCVLFMINAGMRLAAPSFIWGLTFVTIISSVQSRRLGRSPVVVERHRNV